VVARDTDVVFLGHQPSRRPRRWYLGRIVESVHAYRLDVARSRASTASQGFDVYSRQPARGATAASRACMGHYGLQSSPSARNAIELVLCGSAGTSPRAVPRHALRAHGARRQRAHRGRALCALRHHYFNSEVHGMHYGEFANYAERVFALPR
jgi:hypothetical protein